jgi:hypothetical protein
MCVIVTIVVLMCVIVTIVVLMCVIMTIVVIISINTMNVKKKCDDNKIYLTSGLYKKIF